MNENENTSDVEKGEPIGYDCPWCGVFNRFAIRSVESNIFPNGEVSEVVETIEMPECGCEVSEEELNESIVYE